MPQKVIIDCDPGIDDSLAIMLALSMPEEIEVVGITVAAGNAPVEMGYGNALKVLKYMGRLDVPVFMGADRPLKRDFVNALDTHGSDGLGESFLPQVPEEEYERQEMNAVQFMQETLQREPVSVIALGPMTNLAMLIEKAPSSFGKIQEIVSMGGTFRSHGNCSPVAEYNYWCDPDAAALVYGEMDRLGRKIHMVGLDVTRRIVLTPDLLDYMKRLDPHTGAFTQKITKFYFDFVAYFACRDLCKGFESYVQIETKGISLGQSIVDSMNFYRHAPNAIVLTEVDTIRFFELFFTRLLRMEEKPDLLPVLCR